MGKGRSIFKYFAKIALVICLLVGSFTPPASAQDDFESAHETLTADPDLQWEMDPRPTPEAVVVPEIEPRKPMPDWLSNVFKAIFWVAVIAAGCLILYFFAMEFARKRFGFGRKTKIDPVPVTDYYRPSDDQVRILLDEADRLAKEGRYAEAAHILLYKSIQDIEKARPREVMSSLTSREISRLDILSAASRDAFTKLARTVEVSFFGREDVSLTEYDMCRRAYENFVQAGKVVA